MQPPQPADVLADDAVVLEVLSSPLLVVEGSTEGRVADGRTARPAPFASDLLVRLVDDFQAGRCIELPQLISLFSIASLTL
jgi:hypothetical protein